MASNGFSISFRFARVWLRNFAVYRKIWKISFLTPLLEPLFYLSAFGIGLSVMVGELSYRGTAMTYTAFLAPALIAMNVMNGAFFETTYASFVRMYYQKTFDAMMATPLSLEEIITGEIVWGATKSVMVAAVITGVVSFFGYISYPSAFFILPLAFLSGLAFGSLGMFFTSIVPSIEAFNLPVFLFITPMFLFSGTFFPLENLPLWAQRVAYALPLTHLVDATRAFSYGIPGLGILWNVLYLSAFVAVFYPIALVKMRKRLIK
ncbi:MAG: ABC transporter permease [Deltaproteobacteria bacterium]|nr:ABC transporter permease [Deltaproteobacteria bacterium]